MRDVSVATWRAGSGPMQARPLLAGFAQLRAFARPQTPLGAKDACSTDEIGRS